MSIRRLPVALLAVLAVGVAVIGVGRPAHAAPADSDDAGFGGTWKYDDKTYPQFITISRTNGAWSVTGAYRDHDGKEVGTFHGENVRFADGVLTFRRLIDRKPPITAGNRWLCKLELKDGHVAYEISEGNRSYRHTFDRVSGPAATAQAGGPGPIPATAKPPETRPATTPPPTTPTTPASAAPAVGREPRRGHTVSRGGKPAPVDGSQGTEPTGTAAAARGTTGDLARTTPGTSAPASRTPATGPAKSEHQSATKVMHGVEPQMPPSKPAATVTFGAPVWTVAVSPDGHKLAAGGHDPGHVYLYDIAQQKEVWSRKDLLDGNNPLVHALAFSPDGKLLAVGGTGLADFRLALLDTVTGKERPCPVLAKAPSACLAFNPKKPTMLAFGANWNVQVADIAQNRVLWKADKAFESLLDSLAFSPDGEYLAVAGSHGSPSQIKVYDANTGAVVHEFPRMKQAVAGARFSPDGKFLVAYYAQFMSKGFVTVWDAATWQEVRQINDFPDGSFGVHHPFDFFPDSRTLAVADWKQNVQLVDFTTGQKLGAFGRVYGGPVFDVVVTPDGKTLVTCDETKEVKFWNRADAQPASAVPAP